MLFHISFYDNVTTRNILNIDQIISILLFYYKVLDLKRPIIHYNSSLIKLYIYNYYILKVWQFIVSLIININHKTCVIINYFCNSSTYT
jgi:hypothetical protein